MSKEKILEPTLDNLVAIIKQNGESLCRDEIKLLVSAVRGNSNYLIGFFNVIKMFIHINKNIEKLIKPESRDELAKIYSIAKAIWSQKDIIVRCCKNFYIPEEMEDARVTKLYGDYPIYTSLFHGTRDEDETYDHILAHEYAFFMAGTRVKIGTEKKWSLAIRQLGDADGKNILEIICELLEGDFSSGAFYKAFKKINKFTYPDIDEKLVLQLKRFFKSAHRKYGKTKNNNSPKNKISKKGGKNKLRGSRRKFKGDFELYKFLDDFDEDYCEYQYEINLDTENIKNGKSYKKKEKNKRKIELTRYYFDEYPDPEIQTLGLSKSEFLDDREVIFSNESGINTGLFSYDEYRRQSQFKKVAVQREMAMSHNDFNLLNYEDISKLFEFFEYQYKNNIFIDKFSEKIIEPIILLELMLVTGRTLKELSGCKYSSLGPNPERKLNNILFVPEELVLYVPVNFKFHANPKNKGVTNSALPIANSLPITLPITLAKRLTELCSEKGEMPIKKWKYLFSEELRLKNIKKGMMKYLRQINKRYGTNLKLSSVQSWLYRKAIETEGIGRLRAVYLTGKDDAFIKVHATYVSLSVAGLVNDYQKIINELRQYYRSTKELYVKLEADHPYLKYYAGSRLTPKKESLNRFVQYLKPTKIIIKNKTREVRRKELNKLALFTAYWCAIESCYRAVKDFFPEPQSFNFIKNCAVVDEKDFDGEIHPRLVYFTDKFSVQFKDYLESLIYFQDLIESQGYSIYKNNSDEIYIPPVSREEQKANWRDRPDIFFTIDENSKVDRFN